MPTYILRLFIATLMFAAVAGCKSGPKDADIQKEVNEKIQASSTDGTRLNGQVADGVVTLTGSFKDDATKSAVETTVKAIPGVKSVVDNATVTPPAPIAAPATPVTINNDEVLTRGVTDATKDYPSVKATVKDSVIILTGEIERPKLRQLMMSLHSLHPKNVDNKELKIK